MISEHLSADLRSEYLRGVSAPGAALAVETHIAFCEQCRRTADWTERLVWTATSEATPGQVLGLARPLEDDPAVGFSVTLGDIATGRWRRVGPGVRHAPLRGVSGLGESVHLLKAAADAPLGLPAATHLLLVLEGAIRTAANVYQPGNLIETAGARLREARAYAVSGSLCLVVGDDDLYARQVVDRPMRLRA